MTRVSVRDCLRRSCLRGGSPIQPRSLLVVGGSFIFSFRAALRVDHRRSLCALGIRYGSSRREKISGVQLWRLNVLLSVAAAEPVGSPTERHCMQRAIRLRSLSSTFVSN